MPSRRASARARGVRGSGDASCLKRDQKREAHKHTCGSLRWRVKPVVAVLCGRVRGPLTIVQGHRVLLGQRFLLHNALILFRRALACAKVVFASIDCARQGCTRRERVGAQRRR